MPDGRWRAARDRVFSILTMHRRHATVLGISLSLTGASPRMRYVMFRGYEKADAALASRVLSPSDRVLELGSAAGFMALHCVRNIGIDANHYAMVEANPELVRLAKQNFATNRVSFPVAMFAAVTAQDGPVTFHINRNYWSSSILPREQSEPTTVTGMTIPSIISTLSFAPNVLLMDIEGAEADIPPEHFNPFDKVIVEIHPKLIGRERAESLLRALTESRLRLVDRAGGTVAMTRS